MKNFTRFLVIFLTVQSTLLDAVNKKVVANGNVDPAKIDADLVRLQKTVGPSFRAFVYLRDSLAQASALVTNGHYDAGVHKNLIELFLRFHADDSFRSRFEPRERNLLRKEVAQVLRATTQKLPVGEVLSKYIEIDYTDGPAYFGLRSLPILGRNNTATALEDDKEASAYWVAELLDLTVDFERIVPAEETNNLSQLHMIFNFAKYPMPQAYLLTVERANLSETWREPAKIIPGVRDESELVKYVLQSTMLDLRDLKDMLEGSVLKQLTLEEKLFVAMLSHKPLNWQSEAIALYFYNLQGEIRFSDEALEAIDTELKEGNFEFLMDYPREYPTAKALINRRLVSADLKLKALTKRLARSTGIGPELVWRVMQLYKYCLTTPELSAVLSEETVDLMLEFLERKVSNRAVISNSKLRDALPSVLKSFAQHTLTGNQKARLLTFEQRNKFSLGACGRAVSKIVTWQNINSIVPQ